MKKVLIIGSHAPISSKIQNFIKNEGLDIVVDTIEVKDNMKLQYLNTYEKLMPVLKFSETKNYDKPKSKFHK